MQETGNAGANLAVHTFAIMNFLGNPERAPQLAKAALVQSARDSLATSIIIAKGALEASSKFGTRNPFGERGMSKPLPICQY